MSLIAFYIRFLSSVFLDPLLLDAVHEHIAYGASSRFLRICCFASFVVALPTVVVHLRQG